MGTAGRRACPDRRSKPSDLGFRGAPGTTRTCDARFSAVVLFRCPRSPLQPDEGSSHPATELSDLFADVRQRRCCVLPNAVLAEVVLELVGEHGPVAIERGPRLHAGCDASCLAVLLGVVARVDPEL